MELKMTPRRREKINQYLRYLIRTGRVKWLGPKNCEKRQVSEKEMPQTEDQTGEIQ
ncbi:MAG: hypothetical protein U5L00_18430 [Desulfovermiculus sp.]|nr:hypothetical protein [Desulfovermiculus sp.]